MAEKSQGKGKVISAVAILRKGGKEVVISRWKWFAKKRRGILLQERNTNI